MELTLRSETQRYLEDQVRSGHFDSPEAVVEAAIQEVRAIAEMELDDATIDAINEAEAQGDRGEGIEFDEVRRRLNLRAGR